MDFFAGLLGGLSSSMPIGPINLMLLDMASRRSVAAPAFVLGVCLADGLLASLTLWGSLYILLEPNVALILGLTCAGLMFVYGVMSWRAKPASNIPQAPQALNAPKVMVSTALLGFGLCILNPLFSVFWLSYIVSYKEVFAVSSVGMPGFVSGLVIGDLIWFSVIAFIAIRYISQRSPHVLNRLRRATSIVILLFSAYLFSVVLRHAFEV
jgi:threonine/homoserine/homoserine lactone efflux protein